MNLTDIQKLIAIVGGTLAIVGSIIGFFVWLKKRWLAIIHVRRIVSSEDPDLAEVCRLHRELFSDEVADDPLNLQRWLEEDVKAQERGETKLDDMLFAAKLSGNIVGYLYAQYYTSTRLVFISYLAIDDEQRLPRHKVVICLFQRLLKHLKSMRYDWRGIVGELEEYKPGKKQSVMLHARKLMIVFRQTLRKFCVRYGIETDLYRICINYRQPILNPEDVGPVVVDASYNQWLAFVPRDMRLLTQTKTGAYIDKAFAMDILRLILLETYADAFEKDAAYKAYLKREFERYANELPESIKLTRDWRTHSTTGGLTAATNGFAENPCTT